MVHFDELLLESDPFDFERASQILVGSGFIPKLTWNGDRVLHDMMSIKLPTDGYIELMFIQRDAGIATLQAIIFRNRAGEEVPAMTSDFNIARQVIAYALGWANEKIAKYAFWPFEGQVTQGDQIFLWHGAVDMSEKWFDLATTKFGVQQKRIEATKKFFKDYIQHESNHRA